ncbi:hypothetical protein BDF22DRAFT_184083 [Syncephalis plumigaleata]|nr:hypothetical protein BDF22DRAFT_184083 [Syncephalis plumigaleata]
MRCFILFCAILLCSVLYFLFTTPYTCFGELVTVGSWPTLYQNIRILPFAYCPSTLTHHLRWLRLWYSLVARRIPASSFICIFHRYSVWTHWHSSVVKNAYCQRFGPYFSVIGLAIPTG